MIGAIAGDILGSTFEHFGVKTTEFPLFPEGSRFTDDSVLTVATAFSLLLCSNAMADIQMSVSDGDGRNSIFSSNGQKTHTKHRQPQRAAFVTGKQSSQIHLAKGHSLSMPHSRNFWDIFLSKATTTSPR